MKTNRYILCFLMFSFYAAIDLHAQQRDPDQKLFEETKIKAEAGDIPAQYDLGSLYKKGKGVAQDKVAARGWIQKSAEQGFAQAQMTLADIVLFDTNSPNHKPEAFAWALKAANQDYTPAQFWLGFEYYLAADYGNALIWLNKAAEKNWYAAQYQLGMMYLDGKGVVKDYKKAYSYFSPSALAGNEGSQYMLGYMYAGGLGMDRDIVQAYKWGYLSAAQGNKYAKKGLEDLRKNMSEDQLNQANELIKKIAAEIAANEIAAPSVSGAISTEKKH